MLLDVDSAGFRFLRRLHRFGSRHTALINLAVWDSSFVRQLDGLRRNGVCRRMFNGGSSQQYLAVWMVVSIRNMGGVERA